MRKFLPYILAAVLLPAFPAASFPSESSHFQELVKSGGERNKQKLWESARLFFKKYPRSERVPDVRLILADAEDEPERAVSLYRVLTEKYRYYPRRDYALCRICEINYLRSRWQDVVKDAAEAERAFPRSPYLYSMRRLSAMSLLHMDRYEEAREICRAITREHHGYEELAGALLLLAHIERRFTGDSRDYVLKLNEIIAGFNRSESAPTALYMLGKYFEQKGDYDRAYSAYLDVRDRYPRSPEAMFSLGRLDAIRGRNPSRVSYLPDRKYINGLDSIDLSPEIKVNERAGAESGLYFAVTLGPFENIRQAMVIQRLVEKEFSPVELIKVARSYRLYIGRAADTDAALTVKIRLAEEYGINGAVVRVTRDKNRKYIYGE